MPEFATVPLLLVENDEQDVWILQRAFKSLDVTNPVFLARDGEEAINYLSSKGEYVNRDEFPLPYLVFLDLKMPKLDGFEVLRFIRSTPALEHLFVVVLTGPDRNREVTRALEMGADSYLVKPGDLADLQDLLALLEKHWLLVNRMVEFRREMAGA